MSSNRVHAGSFLTLHYRLATADGGDIVNTFGGDRPATLSLGTGVLASAIESRLIGLAEGAHESFDFAHGVVFGERNADMLQRVSRALLSEHGAAAANYGVGDVLQFSTPDGLASHAGVVREADEEGLLVDFNHPLAGIPLTFEVQLIGVL